MRIVVDHARSNTMRLARNGYPWECGKPGPRFSQRWRAARTGVWFPLFTDLGDTY